MGIAASSYTPKLTRSSRLCGAIVAPSAHTELRMCIELCIRASGSSKQHCHFADVQGACCRGGQDTHHCCMFRRASICTEATVAEGAEAALVHASLLQAGVVGVRNHARDPGHTSGDQVRQVASLEGSSVCKGDASALSTLGCSLGHRPGLPEQAPMQHQRVACRAQALRPRPVRRLRVGEQCPALGAGEAVTASASKVSTPCWQHHFDPLLAGSGRGCHL